MQIKVAIRAVESLLNRHDELRSTDSGTKQAFILKVKVLPLVVTQVFFLLTLACVQKPRNQNGFTVSVILLWAYKGETPGACVSQSLVSPGSINFCAP